MRYRLQIQSWIFPCLVLWLSIIFNTKAQSIELMIGNDNIQGDIQWLKPFSEKSNFLFFNRNRFTVDYYNKTTYFISGITAYEIGKKGFGVANEIHISNHGLLPKIGVQYLKANEKLIFYALLNSGYIKELKYGFFSFIRYQPKFNELMNWYFQLEVVHNFNSLGNEFSAQRPRIGLSFRHTQFGLAGDFNQIGDKWYFRSNVGLFVSVRQSPCRGLLVLFRTVFFPV